jgi:hypothetical protein
MRPATKTFAMDMEQGKEVKQELAISGFNGRQRGKE